MDVVIIGGGVIGLSVAEALARRGADVTVLEARSWGRGASEGNAGWISPGLANPVPGPGVMTQALKWMPNPRSPLLVRPAPRLSFLRWSLDFWRATGQDRYGAGMAALAALGSRVLEDFDRLAAAGVAMELHAAGLLFVGRTAAGVRSEARILRDAQALGYLGEIRELGRAETLAHEPALTDRLAGSVLAVDERHVRPETLTAGLVAHLRAGGRADLRAGVAARAVVRDGDRWRVEHDGAGAPLLASRVVVATGWQAGELLAPLGVRLPLEGGKGYSVTVSDPGIQPKGAMYLLEDRVAVTPFDGALRLAGTMELGTSNPKLNRGRIAAIKAAGRRSLVGWDEAGAVEWAGFRPMFPDGLPAIGPVPGLAGLQLATGHAMLGVTLGPTTGELLAPSVLEGRVGPELAPFSLARFGNRVRRAA
jgi:D-amino-acid dehydrogenase